MAYTSDKLLYGADRGDAYLADNPDSVRLEHSCGEWEIGGPDEVRALIGCGSGRRDMPRLCPLRLALLILIAAGPRALAHLALDMLTGNDRVGTAPWEE